MSNHQITILLISFVISLIAIFVTRINSKERREKRRREEAELLFVKKYDAEDEKDKQRAADCLCKITDRKLIPDRSFHLGNLWQCTSCGTVYSKQFDPKPTLHDPPPQK